MKTFARVDNGVVAELLTTDSEIAKLFHPSLCWIAVSEPVQVGWLQEGNGFVPPPPRSSTMQSATPAELQSRLAVLAAEISVLQPKH